MVRLIPVWSGRKISNCEWDTIRTTPPPTRLGHGSRLVMDPWLRLSVFKPPDRATWWFWRASIHWCHRTETSWSKSRILICCWNCYEFVRFATRRIRWKLRALGGLCDILFPLSTISISRGFLSPYGTDLDPWSAKICPIDLSTYGRTVYTSVQKAIKSISKIHQNHCSFLINRCHKSNSMIFKWFLFLIYILYPSFARVPNLITYPLFDRISPIWLHIPYLIAYPLFNCISPI